MFLLRASCFIAELQRFAPAMLAACQEAVAAARHDVDFVRLGTEAFADCPADSIDYAVMEKTDRAAVLPINVGWNDVGSWAALRSEEHTSELQSLMSISYAVFCLKKKKKIINDNLAQQY